MKLEELLERIEKIAPSDLAGLYHMETHLIGNPKNKLSKIGVAVNITDDVLKIAKTNGIDLIVVHHKPSDKYIKKLQQFGILAYVVHLAQDISPIGNNFSLAQIDLDMEGLTPVPIVYNGKVIPNGAVVGNFGTYQDLVIPGYPGICKTTFYEKTIKKLIDDIVGYFTFEFRFDHPVLHPTIISTGDKKRKIKYFAVASGSAFKPEFIEQVHKAGAQAFISSGMVENDNCQYGDTLAKKLDMTLIDIGNYASHVPGMVRMARELNAVFVPDKITQIPKNSSLNQGVR